MNNPVQPRPIEEVYAQIIDAPDFKVYKEVMDCVGRYMAQVDCRHERYELFPYPERLGELSDLLRKHVLREEGNIDLYLKLEADIDALPLINGKPPRQKSQFDDTIIKIISWLKKSIEEIRPVSTVSHKDKIIISLGIWGESYTRKFVDYTLKSLMADGNFPALVKSKHVVLYMQTSEATRDVIEYSDIALQMKAIGVHLQYKIIPDEIVNALINDTYVYWMLGAVASLGIQYARKSQAAFHHAYPDMIYSDKFFSELLRLSQNHRAILAPGHRADESQLLPSIASYGDDKRISIPAADLMAHHMNCMHINGWSCIVNKRPKNWHFPEKHTLIWESEDTIYFDCPHASVLWFSYEVIKDIEPRYFMTLDSELDLICKGQDFYIPQECDELYSAEFSGQSRSPVSDLWTKAEGYASYMWSVITHRDLLKFFIRGMRVPVNRKIRPLSSNHTLFNDRILIERNFLVNNIVAHDMYEGVTLGRPRYHEGRVFKV